VYSPGAKWFLENASVQLETIACNQCGAPLSVPEAAKFVRCNHCAASLAVRRNESVTYTEVVEKLVEHTSKLAEQVAHLRYQAEIARIDREWDRERTRRLVHHKHGPPTEPSRGQAILGGGVAIVFGIMGSIMAGTTGGASFAVFPMVFVVFGLILAIWGTKKADEFERARKRYKAQRAMLQVEDFLDESDDKPHGADDIPPLR
jgi:LSD1 subclass zinc finger protein